MPQNTVINLHDVSTAVENVITDIDDMSSLATTNNIANYDLSIAASIFKGENGNFH
jgi:hypothetical protein